MSGSLLHNLDRIREMQGKDPLPDPTRIPPPGPGDAIPGPLEPYNPDVPKEWLDPELDEIPAGMEPSPLIPKEVMAQAATQAPKADLSNPIGQLLEHGLVVIGRLGAWKGREVQLSE